MHHNDEALDLQNRLAQILGNIRNIRAQTVGDIRFYMRLHRFVQDNDTLQNALVDLRSLYQYGKAYLAVSDEFLEAVIAQCSLNSDILHLEPQQAIAPGFLSIWSSPARLRDGFDARLSNARL